MSYENERTSSFASDERPLSAIARYCSAVALAGSMTFVLLFVMQHLIESDDLPPDAVPPNVPFTFLHEIVEPPPETERTKPKKVEVIKEPEVARAKPTADTNPGELGLAAITPGLREPIKFAAGRPDGGILPVASFAPEYPRRAQEQGIEGFVVVEFTVNKTGEVIDPFIVHSQPVRVFDRAALKAVKRYKYKPQISDGEPVIVTGVRQRLTFELTGSVSI